MSDAVARLSSFALIGLLITAIAAIVLTSHGPLGEGKEIKAEFVDASPLVEGMNVRVSGAVAGSVNEIELNEEGIVEVTMELHDGLPAPRADASAAIRQQDVLGDSYLNLELGHAEAPLSGPIPVERTITSPRFDEFFDIFRPEAREGLQVLLTELGMALEDRGADLNAAILQMRPGFRAAGELFTELRGQNRVFHQALANAHAITEQLAPRSAAIDSSLVDLAETFTEIAPHADDLDEALSNLPASLALARETTASLREAIRAAVPLLDTFGDGAPEFTQAAELLGPFSGHLAATSREITPTIRATTRMLQIARPALYEVRGETAELFSPIVLALEPLAPLLDDLAGAIFSLGNVVVPGNTAADPGTDPARSYLRTYLVISCELFGEPISPGCLERSLADGDVVSEPAGSGTEPPGGGTGEVPSAPDQPDQSDQPGGPPASEPEEVPDLPALDDGLDELAPDNVPLLDFLFGS